MQLRAGEGGMKVPEFMRAAQVGPLGDRAARWWRGSNLFAAIRAVAGFDSPIARDIIRDTLDVVSTNRRRNGTFGCSCQIERAVAVLLADNAVNAVGG